MPITATFPTEPVLPVGNCIELCFETDELILEEGQLIDIKITGLNLETKSGTLTVFGCVIGFGNKQDSLSFISTSRPRTNLTIMEELLDRLSKKYDICSRFELELVAGDGNTLCITSNCFIEDTPPYVTYEGIDPNPINFSLTGNDTGSLPTILDGYRLFYQPFCSDTKKPLARKPFVANFPYNSQEGEVNKIRIDVKGMLRSQVESSCISKENETPSIDTNATKEVYFIYGSQKTNDTGCGNDTLETFKSDPIKVIAAACQCTEKDFSEYDGTTVPVKFLNCVPEEICLPENSCSWLKIYARFVEGTEACVRYDYLLNGTIVNTIDEPLPLMDGEVVDIPIFYDKWNGAFNKVAVTVILKIAGIEVPYSETHCINYSKNGCPKNIMYFRCSKGGFDPVTCFKLEEIESESSGEEICTDVSCQPFKEKLKNGGRGTYNKETNEIRKYRTDTFKQDDLEFLKEFKASPEVYIMDEIDGEFCLRRLIIEPNSIILYRNEGKFTATIEGRFGENFNTL